MNMTNFLLFFFFRKSTKTGKSFRSKCSKWPRQTWSQSYKTFFPTVMRQNKLERLSAQACFTFIVERLAL